MRNKKLQKIICLVVACLFFVNDISYAFGPGIVSGGLRKIGQDGEPVKDAMYAAGQKLFASKHGPGAIDWKEIESLGYGPGHFTGKVPKIPGITPHEIDYSNLDGGMEESTFFKNVNSHMRDKGKIDLIKALNYFREHEAHIPEANLKIKEGYFDLEKEADGELGIARIEKYGKDDYILVIHSDFVKKWNQLIENDICIKYELKGEKRVVSQAWGIFFRLAKHEMTDLIRLGLIPKGNLSHLTSYPPPQGDHDIPYLVVPSEIESQANSIQGRFNLINDAMWLWFLGSYCFNNATRYNNDILRERLEWFFNNEDKNKDTEKLKLEFPNLLEDDSKQKAEEKQKEAIDFALWINNESFGNKKKLEPIKRNAELTPQEKNIRELARVFADYFVDNSETPSDKYGIPNRVLSAARDRLIEYVEKAIGYAILYRGGFPRQSNDIESVKIEEVGPAVMRVAIAAEKLPDSFNNILRRTAIDVVQEVYNDKSSELRQEIESRPAIVAVRMYMEESINRTKRLRLKDEVFVHAFGQSEIFVTSKTFVEQIESSIHDRTLENDYLYSRKDKIIGKPIYATGGDQPPAPRSHSYDSVAARRQTLYKIMKGMKTPPDSEDVILLMHEKGYADYRRGTLTNDLNYFKKAHKKQKGQFALKYPNNKIESVQRRRQALYKIIKNMKALPAASDIIAMMPKEQYPKYDYSNLRYDLNVLSQENNAQFTPGKPVVHRADLLTHDIHELTDILDDRTPAARQLKSRICNGLKRNSIEYIGELTVLDANEMLELRGVWRGLGKESFAALVEACIELGLKDSNFVRTAVTAGLFPVSKAGKRLNRRPPARKPEGVDFSLLPDHRLLNALIYLVINNPNLNPNLGKKEGEEMVRGGYVHEETLSLNNRPIKSYWFGKFNSVNDYNSETFFGLFLQLVDDKVSKLKPEDKNNFSIRNKIRIEVAKEILDTAGLGYAGKMNTAFADSMMDCFRMQFAHCGVGRQTMYVMASHYSEKYAILTHEEAEWNIHLRQVYHRNSPSNQSMGRKGYDKWRATNAKVPIYIEGSFKNHEGETELYSSYLKPVMTYNAFVKAAYEIAERISPISDLLRIKRKSGVERNIRKFLGQLRGKKRQFPTAGAGSVSKEDKLHPILIKEPSDKDKIEKFFRGKASEGQHLLVGPESAKLPYKVENMVVETLRDPKVYKPLLKRFTESNVILVMADIRELPSITVSDKSGMMRTVKVRTWISGKDIFIAVTDKKEWRILSKHSAIPSSAALKEGLKIITQVSYMDGKRFDEIKDDILFHNNEKAMDDLREDYSGIPRRAELALEGLCQWLTIDEMGKLINSLKRPMSDEEWDNFKKTLLRKHDYPKKWQDEMAPKAWKDLKRRVAKPISREALKSIEAEVMSYKNKLSPSVEKLIADALGQMAGLDEWAEFQCRGYFLANPLSLPTDNYRDSWNELDITDKGFSDIVFRVMHPIPNDEASISSFKANLEEAEKSGDKEAALLCRIDLLNAGVEKDIQAEAISDLLSDRHISVSAKAAGLAALHIAGLRRLETLRKLPNEVYSYTNNYRRHLVAHAALLPYSENKIEHVEAIEAIVSEAHENGDYETEAMALLALYADKEKQNVRLAALKDILKIAKERNDYNVYETILNYLPKDETSGFERMPTPPSKKVQVDVSGSLGEQGKKAIPVLASPAKSPDSTPTIAEVKNPRKRKTIYTAIAFGLILTAEFIAGQLVGPSIAEAMPLIMMLTSFTGLIWVGKTFEKEFPYQPKEVSNQGLKPQPPNEPKTPEPKPTPAPAPSKEALANEHKNLNGKTEVVERINYLIENKVLLEELKGKLAAKLSTPSQPAIEIMMPAASCFRWLTQRVILYNIYRICHGLFNVSIKAFLKKLPFGFKYLITMAEEKDEITSGPIAAGPYLTFVNGDRGLTPGDRMSLYSHASVSTRNRFIVELDRMLVYVNEALKKNPDEIIKVKVHAARLGLSAIMALMMLRDEGKLERVEFTVTDANKDNIEKINKMAALVGVEKHIKTSVENISTFHAEKDNRYHVQTAIGPIPFSPDDSAVEGILRNMRQAATTDGVIIVSTETKHWTKPIIEAIHPYNTTVRTPKKMLEIAKKTGFEAGPNEWNGYKGCAFKGPRLPVMVFVSTAEVLIAGKRFIRPVEYLRALPEQLDAEFVKISDLIKTLEGESRALAKELADNRESPSAEKIKERIGNIQKDLEQLYANMRTISIEIAKYHKGEGLQGGPNEEADRKPIDLELLRTDIKKALGSQKHAPKEQFDIVHGILNEKYPTLAGVLTALAYLISEESAGNITEAIKATGVPIQEQRILILAFPAAATSLDNKAAQVQIHEERIGRFDSAKSAWDAVVDLYNTKRATWFVFISRATYQSQPLGQQYKFNPDGIVAPDNAVRISSYLTIMPSTHMFRFIEGPVELFIDDTEGGVVKMVPIPTLSPAATAASASRPAMPPEPAQHKTVHGMAIEMLASDVSPEEIRHRGNLEVAEEMEFLMSEKAVAAVAEAISDIGLSVYEIKLLAMQYQKGNTGLRFDFGREGRLKIILARHGFNIVSGDKVQKEITAKVAAKFLAKVAEKMKEMSQSTRPTKLIDPMSRGFGEKPQDDGTDDWRRRIKEGEGGTMGRWEYDKKTELSLDGTRLTLHNPKRIPNKGGVIEEEFRNPPNKIVLQIRELSSDEKTKVLPLLQKLGISATYKVIVRDEEAIKYRIYGIATQGIPFIHEDIIAEGDPEAIEEALYHENQELTGKGHDVIRAEQKELYKEDKLRALIKKLSDKDKAAIAGAEPPSATDKAFNVNFSIRDASGDSDADFMIRAELNIPDPLTEGVMPLGYPIKIDTLDSDLMRVTSDVIDQIVMSRRMVGNNSLTTHQFIEHIMIERRRDVSHIISCTLDIAGRKYHTEIDIRLLRDAATRDAEAAKIIEALATISQAAFPVSPAPSQAAGKAQSPAIVPLRLLKVPPPSPGIRRREYGNAVDFMKTCKMIFRSPKPVIFISHGVTDIMEETLAEYMGVNLFKGHMSNVSMMVDVSGIVVKYKRSGRFETRWREYLYPYYEHPDEVSPIAKLTWAAKQEAEAGKAKIILGAWDTASDGNGSFRTLMNSLKDNLPGFEVVAVSNSYGVTDYLVMDSFLNEAELSNEVSKELGLAEPSDYHKMSPAQISDHRKEIIRQLGKLDTELRTIVDLMRDVPQANIAPNRNKKYEILEKIAELDRRVNMLKTNRPGVHTGENLGIGFDEEEKEPTAVPAANAKNKSVMIVGGAGYIGSTVVNGFDTLARSYLDRGYEVKVYDNFSAGHAAALPPGITPVQGDLADKDALKRALIESHTDTVIHFAAFIEVGESVRNPAKFFENNIINTIILLEAMREAGVKKIVFSSSAAVYGKPESVPINEDAKLAPINPYGETKYMMELLLREYAKKYRFKAVAFRYFNAAGAFSCDCGEDHDPESHIIPSFIKAVLSGGKITINGDGKHRRDYINVKDLAAAHIRAVKLLNDIDTANPADGSFNYFNLGTQKMYSNLEIARLVIRKVYEGRGETVTDQRLEELMKDIVIFGPERPGDPPDLCASNEKARRELGWEPKYSDIETIISDAIEWHQKHPEGFDETLNRAKDRNAKEIVNEMVGFLEPNEAVSLEFKREFLQRLLNDEINKLRVLRPEIKELRDPDIVSWAEKNDAEQFDIFMTLQTALEEPGPAFLKDPGVTRRERKALLGPNDVPEASEATQEQVARRPVDETPALGKSTGQPDDQAIRLRTMTKPAGTGETPEAPVAAWEEVTKTATINWKNGWHNRPSHTIAFVLNEIRKYTKGDVTFIVIDRNTRDEKDRICVGISPTVDISRVSLNAVYHDTVEIRMAVECPGANQLVDIIRDCMQDERVNVATAKVEDEYVRWIQKFFGVETGIQESQQELEARARLLEGFAARRKAMEAAQPPPKESTPPGKGHDKPGAGTAYSLYELAPHDIVNAIIGKAIKYSKKEPVVKFVEHEYYRDDTDIYWFRGSNFKSILSYLIACKEKEQRKAGGPRLLGEIVLFEQLLNEIFDEINASKEIRDMYPLTSIDNMRDSRALLESQLEKQFEHFGVEANKDTKRNNVYISSELKQDKDKIIEHVDVERALHRMVINEHFGGEADRYRNEWRRHPTIKLDIDIAINVDSYNSGKIETFRFKSSGDYNAFAQSAHEMADRITKVSGLVVKTEQAPTKQISEETIIGAGPAGQKTKPLFYDVPVAAPSSKEDDETKRLIDLAVSAFPSLEKAKPELQVAAGIILSRLNLQDPEIRKIMGLSFDPESVLYTRFTIKVQNPSNPTKDIIGFEIGIYRGMDQVRKFEIRPIREFSENETLSTVYTSAINYAERGRDTMEEFKELIVKTLQEQRDLPAWIEDARNISKLRLTISSEKRAHIDRLADKYDRHSSVVSNLIVKALCAKGPEEAAAIMTALARHPGIAKQEAAEALVGDARFDVIITPDREDAIGKIQHKELQPAVRALLLDFDIWLLDGSLKLEDEGKAARITVKGLEGAFVLAENPAYRADPKHNNRWVLSHKSHCYFTQTSKGLIDAVKQALRMAEEDEDWKALVARARAAKLKAAVSKPGEPPTGGHKGTAGTNADSLKELAPHSLVNALLGMAIEYKNNPNMKGFVKYVEKINMFIYGEKGQNTSFLDIFNKLARILWKENHRIKAYDEKAAQKTLLKELLSGLGYEKEYTWLRNQFRVHPGTFLRDFMVQLDAQFEHFGVEKKTIHVMEDTIAQKGPIAVMNHVKVEENVYNQAWQQRDAKYRDEPYGDFLDEWRQTQQLRSINIKLPHPIKVVSGKVTTEEDNFSVMCTYDQLADIAHAVAEEEVPLHERKGEINLNELVPPSSSKQLHPPTSRPSAGRRSAGADIHSVPEELRGVVQNILTRNAVNLLGPGLTVQKGEEKTIVEVKIANPKNTQNCRQIIISMVKEPDKLPVFGLMVLYDGKPVVLAQDGKELTLAELTVSVAEALNKEIESESWKNWLAGAVGKEPSGQNLRKEAIQAAAHRFKAVNMSGAEVLDMAGEFETGKDTAVPIQDILLQLGLDASVSDQSEREWVLKEIASFLREVAEEMGSYTKPSWSAGPTTTRLETSDTIKVGFPGTGTDIPQKHAIKPRSVTKLRDTIILLKPRTAEDALTSLIESGTIKVENGFVYIIGSSDVVPLETVRQIILKLFETQTSPLPTAQPAPLHLTGDLGGGSKDVTGRAPEPAAAVGDSLTSRERSALERLTANGKSGKVKAVGKECIVVEFSATNMPADSKYLHAYYVIYRRKGPAFLDIMQSFSKIYLPGNDSNEAIITEGHYFIWAHESPLYVFDLDTGFNLRSDNDGDYFWGKCGRQVYDHDKRAGYELGLSGGVLTITETNGNTSTVKLNDVSPESTPAPAAKGAAAATPTTSAQTTPLYLTGDLGGGSKDVTGRAPAPAAELVDKILTIGISPAQVEQLMSSYNRGETRAYSEWGDRLCYLCSKLGNAGIFKGSGFKLINPAGEGEKESRVRFLSQLAPAMTQRVSDIARQVQGIGLSKEDIDRISSECLFRGNMGVWSGDNATAEKERKLIALLEKMGFDLYASDKVRKKAELENAGLLLVLVRDAIEVATPAPALGKQPKGNPKAGKSPEAAKVILAFGHLDGKIFTARDYLELYRKYWRDFGFDEPAENEESALRTVRRDLNEYDDSLVNQGVLDKKGKDKYLLTKKGAEEIGRIRGEVLNSPRSPLNEHERKVLVGRYFEAKERARSEIGKQFEKPVSPERVRQIEKHTFLKAAYFYKYLRRNPDMKALDKEPVYMLAYFSKPVQTTLRLLREKIRPGDARDLTIEELRNSTERDLYKVAEKGFGKKGLEEVKAALKKYGLALRVENPANPSASTGEARPFVDLVLEAAGLKSSEDTSKLLHLRISNALDTMQIVSFEALADRDIEDFSRIRNFGEKCLEIIANACRNSGLENGRLITTYDLRALRAELGSLKTGASGLDVEHRRERIAIVNQGIATLSRRLAGLQARPAAAAPAPAPEAPKGRTEEGKNPEDAWKVVTSSSTIQKALEETGYFTTAEYAEGWPEAAKIYDWKSSPPSNSTILRDLAKLQKEYKGEKGKNYLRVKKIGGENCYYLTRKGRLHALREQHRQKTQDLKDHPLIKVISEYIVNIASNDGPGSKETAREASKEPTLKELESIYKTIDLLGKQQIEIFWPQRRKLTKEVNDAIKDIGKREGRQNVVCRQYSNFQRLADMLRQHDGDTPYTKRIIITNVAEDASGEEDQKTFSYMLNEYPLLFLGTPVINMAMSKDYERMSKVEKTAFQADIIMKAILSRLYEKDKTPFVELLLRAMLQGTVKDVDNFIRALEKAGSTAGLNMNDIKGRHEFVLRICALLDQTISVGEKIGREIRLMKNFWIAA